MSPVKGSDLANQIELARQSIERWPQWLKDAAGIGKESDEAVSGEKSSIPKIPLSPADFID
ncbi:MAG TPA: hypothetical protein VIU34_23880 [Steroidobacter sp.]